MVTAVLALLGTGKYQSKGVFVQNWAATITGVGNPLSAAALPDKTVSIAAATSTGAGTSRVIIEGTNEDWPTTPTATWETLTSPTDGDMDFTALPTVPIIRALRENPLWIRPRYVTVTTGAVLQVIIVAR